MFSARISRRWQRPLKEEQYNKVLVFRIVPNAPASVYNGTTYIDTMSRKAVDRFIELTHEAYKEHCGNRIGGSIRGILPTSRTGDICWTTAMWKTAVEICSAAYTDDFFEEFEKRYGYQLRPLLPELFFRKDGRKVAKTSWILLISAITSLLNALQSRSVNGATKTEWFLQVMCCMRIRLRTRRFRTAL